jgi:hypothetical protein
MVEGVEGAIRRDGEREGLPGLGLPDLDGRAVVSPDQ